jgi:hypothetical protein
LDEAVSRMPPDRLVLSLDEDQAMSEPRKNSRTNFDLDDLLHPARAFGHPSEVVHDPDLTLNEKRAILASWASDACTIEAAPTLRQGPAGTPVSFDEVMDALRMLDKQAGEVPRRWQRTVRRRRLFDRGRGGQTGQGSSLH